MFRGLRVGLSLQQIGRSIYAGCKRLEGPLQKDALAPTVNTSDKVIVSKPAAADSSHRERIKTNVKSAAANLAESLITGTIASIPGEVRPNTDPSTLSVNIRNRRVAIQAGAKKTCQGVHEKSQLQRPK